MPLRFVSSLTPKRKSGWRTPEFLLMFTFLASTRNRTDTVPLSDDAQDRHRPFKWWRARRSEWQVESTIQGCRPTPKTSLIETSWECTMPRPALRVYRHSTIQGVSGYVGASRPHNPVYWWWAAGISAAASVSHRRHVHSSVDVSHVHVNTSDVNVCIL